MRIGKTNAIFGGGGGVVYTITNLFDSYVHTSNTSSRIPSGRSYQSTITVDDGYVIDSITVMMGETPIEVINNQININSVIGNIVVEVVANAGNNVIVTYNLTNITKS